jgi:hypothetical protein
VQFGRNPIAARQFENQRLIPGLEKIDALDRAI